MMSVAEFLVILVCGIGLFLVLAVGAWVLINKSKLESPPTGTRQQEKLDALDREYAAGDLDESEYDRRRSEILNDRMQ